MHSHHCRKESPSTPLPQGKCGVQEILFDSFLQDSPQGQHVRLPLGTQVSRINPDPFTCLSPAIGNLPRSVCWPPFPALSLPPPWVNLLFQGHLTQSSLLTPTCLPWSLFLPSSCLLYCLSESSHPLQPNSALPPLSRLLQCLSLQASGSSLKHGSI